MATSPPFAVIESVSLPCYHWGTDMQAMRVRTLNSSLLGELGLLYGRHVCLAHGGASVSYGTFVGLPSDFNPQCGGDFSDSVVTVPALLALLQPCLEIPLPSLPPSVRLTQERARQEGCSFSRSGCPRAAVRLWTFTRASRIHFVSPGWSPQPRRAGDPQFADGPFVCWRSAPGGSVAARSTTSSALFLERWLMTVRAGP